MDGGWIQCDREVTGCSEREVTTAWDIRKASQKRRDWNYVLQLDGSLAGSSGTRKGIAARRNKMNRD
jgi:hypothetical protein